MRQARGLRHARAMGFFCLASPVRPLAPVLPPAVVGRYAPDLKKSLIPTPYIIKEVQNSGRDVRVIKLFSDGL